MKTTSKFLSVILATFLLLQTFSMICFAETTSDLPTDFGWHATKKGYYQFTIPDHINDVRYEYDITLYKDGSKVYQTSSSVHPTVYVDERTQSFSFLRDQFAKNGSGNYTFTLTVNGETTAESIPLPYEEPAQALPVPQNVVLVDGQVRWTPVVSDYCYSYMVYYYVGYPDGTIDFFYGEEEKPATADYQDFTNDSDVHDGFVDQVERRYAANPTRYPKESAFLMAAVKANTNDIFEMKSSEFSTPVAMSEDTETEFHFNLPNVSAEKGATITFSDVDDYVPQRMQFGLVYASNLYEQNIETPATITYTGNGVNYTQTLDEIPLTTENGAAWYDLEFTLPADLASGTYQAVIRLAIATEKDADDVKPYVITIPELTINPTYAADFVINDGADMATDETLSLSFTVDGYTKYKVGEGEYITIPANNTATYAVSPESGEKEITITFANNDESRTATVTKSILLSNRHTITYYADGEVFDTVVLDCGTQIPSVQNFPTAEGKTFAGWDAEIPVLMPDSDLTFHAVFMNDVQLDNSALLTEEEIAEGFSVSASTTVAVATTPITDVLETQYSRYEVAMTLDITISKVKEGNSPIAITEPDALIAFEIEIPSTLTNKGEYLILREHNGQVDAITATPNADGEYLSVSGNVITLYAKKFSVYTLATREVTLPVGGGVLSYAVNFNSNGGTKVNAVNVRAGKTVARPEDPTKEGYTFAGWYLDAELTEAFDFETKIRKSVSLYAKWEENAPKTVMVLTIGEADATVNGETVTNDVAPVIVNDRTMLPIRFVAETFGATVEWNETTRAVNVTLGDVKVSLIVGEGFAIVNGEAKVLDSASFIENDRTYLPVRFVMESLGLKVEWNETTRQVTVAK